MYNFKGQKCPYCGNAFSEKDDIVVCPECGTPHHRSCYFEHKMCANEYRHGAFEWSPEMPEVPAAGSEGAGVVCARCGKMNPPLSLFCNNCGAPIEGAAADPSSDSTGGGYPEYEGAGQTRPSYGGQGAFGGYQSNQRGTGNAEPFGGAGQGRYSEPFGGAHGGYADPFTGAQPIRQVIDENTEFDGIKAADWARYIGPASTPYYLANFKVQDVYNKKTSFTWSAAIVPYVYFAYRRVWWAAVLSAVVSFLLLIPSNLIMIVEMFTELEMEPPFSFTISQYNALGTAGVVGSVIYFILRMLCGFYAVYVFRRDAAKRIKRIKSGEAMPVSGPSIVGVIAVIAVYFAVVSALMSVVVYGSLGDSPTNVGGLSLLSRLMR